MLISKTLRTVVLLLIPAPFAAAADVELVEVKRIWDLAPHNAFTDLVRFNKRWFCVFREAAGHVAPEGNIRVIESVDGNRWTSAALLRRTGSDLRDPKISITPDGRLMILAAASWHEADAAVNRQPMVWFSEDGSQWSAGTEVGEPNFWLWRVTWHKGVALGVGYGRTAGNRLVRLYESTDGLKFDIVRNNLYDVGYPNETSIVFKKDDTALCLLRRDEAPHTALLGTSRPPYRDWTWKDLGIRIGGPNLIEDANGHFVAATRLYDGQVRTALSWLDPDAGTLTEFLRLPSGGDTSYAGLAWHDGLLWVSYYSSHEGKANIYLAKVRIPT